METVFQVLFNFRWTHVEVAIVFTWLEEIGKYSLIVKALLMSDCLCSLLITSVQML